MSAPSTPGISSPPPQLHGMDRLRHFWQRISEGRQIDELWSHFTADARASYGFYMKESDAEELQGQHGIRRWFRICKILFWSLLMKMTPARRVPLPAAVFFLAISAIKFYCLTFFFMSNFTILAP